MLQKNGDPYKILKQSGLGGSHSGTVLAKNIKASKPPGYIKLPGYQSHHIIPGGETYAEAKDLRKKLDNLGVDINEAVNGIDLDPQFHKLTQKPNAQKYCIAIQARINAHFLLDVVIQPNWSGMNLLLLHLILERKLNFGNFAIVNIVKE